MTISPASPTRASQEDLQKWVRSSKWAAADLEPIAYLLLFGFGIGHLLLLKKIGAVLRPVDSIRG
jgi:hypothetical protein